VQFDDPVVANAGSLMQTVDVLGDHRLDLVAAHQLGDGAMAPIGGGGAKRFLHREAAAPRLASRLLRGEKIGKVDRRHPGPDPAGAAEIRNSRFGADAGAGEYDGAVRAGNQFGKRADFRIERHRRSVSKVRRGAKPQPALAGIGIRRRRGLARLDRLRTGPVSS